MNVKLSQMLEVEFKVLFDNIYIAVRKSLGNIFCKFGKYELAMTMYFKALHLGPRRHDLYFSIGQTLLFMGNAKDAIKYFEKSLQGDKDNLKYLEGLCQAKIQKEKYYPIQMLKIS